MIFKRLSLVTIVSLMALLAYGQTATVIEKPLYAGKIPNAKHSTNTEERKPHELVDSLAFKVSHPTFMVFTPKMANNKKKAIIICPGGGYGTLLTKREGTDVARALNRQGYTAIVLKYRLPVAENQLEPWRAPIQDAQALLSRLRKESYQYGLEGFEIGVMGFSAGGHLAATLGTHFQRSYGPDTDTAFLRPDFMILINPVISFGEEFGHQGSAKNLLGAVISDKMREQFSNEKQITVQTPPTFLVHNTTDEVVPVENTLAFYQGLRKHQVSAAMHLYPKGEHGFLTYPSFAEWFGRVVQWLDGM